VSRIHFWEQKISQVVKEIRAIKIHQSSLRAVSGSAGNERMSGDQKMSGDGNMSGDGSMIKAMCGKTSCDLSHDLLHNQTRPKIDDQIVPNSIM
jgi:hypothetical protein